MAARNWRSHRVDPLVPNFRRLPQELLQRPADLFGCSRRSGIRLRFRGNSRYVICHATLLDIRLFSHIVFHHFFLIGSPFIVAILHGFLRALSVWLEWCGDGRRGGGGRGRLGRLRKCTKMQDCYPSKRVTNQTKVPFHLSAPVGIACIAKSLSEDAAVLATIPFVTPHKTNADLSRRFQLRDPGHEFQAVRGRPLLARSGHSTKR
jgi:hypothetical protein